MHRIIRIPPCRDRHRPYLATILRRPFITSASARSWTASTGSATTPVTGPWDTASARSSGFPMAASAVPTATWTPGDTCAACTTQPARAASSSLRTNASWTRSPRRTHSSKRTTCPAPRLPLQRAAKCHSEPNSYCHERRSSRRKAAMWRRSSRPGPKWHPCHCLPSRRRRSRPSTSVADFTPRALWPASSTLNQTPRFSPPL